MLNEEQQSKRNEQVKMFRNRNAKKHQYLIRLTDNQYKHLKAMAGDGSMSNVVSSGIDNEWIYFQSVKKLMKGLPHFKSTDDVLKWRVKQFKDSPELLARYVTPAAIMTYTQELEKSRAVNQAVVDNQETIAYLIRKIGNNINQLAHQANAGVDVPRDALNRITKSVIKLVNVIDQSSKEVT